MSLHVLAIGSNRHGFGCLRLTPGGVTWIGDVVGYAGGGAHQVGSAAVDISYAHERI